VQLESLKDVGIKGDDVDGFHMNGEEQTTLSVVMTSSNRRPRVNGEDAVEMPRSGRSGVTVFHQSH
jgi:hypothetical protein